MDNIIHNNNRHVQGVVDTIPIFDHSFTDGLGWWFEYFEIDSQSDLDGKAIWFASRANPLTQWAIGSSP